MSDNLIKFTALLPMKGHSERVKNKNLKDFNGKPLFYYILNTLMACPHVESVYIDTDSEEIAKTAKGFFEKVQIVERPTQLRGDMVSMNDIIKYDMSVIGADNYIQTHATSPLLKLETLNEACERFIDGIDKYDSMFSVNKIQTRFYDENAVAVNHNPEKLIRTQDLTPLYEENSNFYIFTKESFLKTNARIGLKPQMFEMSKLESADIDEETDFIIAEQIHKIINIYIGE